MLQTGRENPTMFALVIHADNGRAFYAPAVCNSHRALSVQNCVCGPNALTFSHADQIEAAKRFGIKPKYAVRVRDAPAPLRMRVRVNMGRRVVSRSKQALYEALADRMTPSNFAKLMAI